MDPMNVTSPAFEHEGDIPRKYTCDGEDVSPRLDVPAPPDGTKTLAVIMDDPDAPTGTFVHWVAWNLPVGTIPEGVESPSGTTSFGRTGYGGPCPPGGTHRYYFKVYALDTTLELPESTRKEELLEAMEGHILAKGELMGRYGR